VGVRKEGKESKAKRKPRDSQVEHVSGVDLWFLVAATLPESFSSSCVGEEGNLRKTVSGNFPLPL